MIEFKTLLYILGAVITIGGSIITFFQMQTRQNMKIEQLQKDFIELKDKLSRQTSNQIKTEKDIAVINQKLDSILDVLNDMKKQRV